MVREIQKRRTVAIQNKKNFETWSHLTGLHGALDFFYAKTIALRILWAVLILVGCILSLNQLIQLITDYQRNPQWVISVSYENDDDIFWPSATLCIRNWLSAKKLQEVTDNDPFVIAFATDMENGIKFYEKWIKMEEESVSDESMQNLERFKSEMENWLQETSSTIEQFKQIRLSKNCEEIIIACGISKKFNVQLDAKSCCQLANYKFSSQPGCFQLDLYSLFGDNADLGYDNAIYFLLDPKMADDYRGIIITDKPSAGFSLELYFDSDEGDSTNPQFFLGPSTNALISMTAEKRQITVRNTADILKFIFPPVSTPCRDNTFMYKFIDYGTYTIKHCHDDCLARYYMYTVNCTDQNQNLREEASRCKGNQSYEWYKLDKTVRSALYANKLDDLPSPVRVQFNLSDCVQKCIEPCTSRTVTAEASQANFPTPNQEENFEEILRKTLNESASYQNLTLLELYYSTDQWRVITKTTRTSIDELISNIGGTLGIFLGISAFSILQAIVYGICRVVG